MRGPLVCATCGAAVARSTPRPACFPFCSERCQLIDLGRWLGEEFRVAGAFDESGGGAEPSAPPSEP